MGKDLTVMRANMRLDLKDSGSLWSDAELNRCIELGHSDFSRFLPRGKTYEERLNFPVTGESVTFPKDTSATYVVNAQTFNGQVAGSTFTIAASPDVPRVLTLLVTDADNSVTDWHIRIYGVDQEDLGVTEDFYFGNGKTQTGKQIFKTVHKVELVEAFTGSAAAGDTLSIGIGAYTDTWVYLANKPIKWTSESATDDASADITRGTDFEIDYIEGKVKAISGGDISAEEVCTFAYDKNQTHIDLTNLADFIRVDRVEYPVGDIPQAFCQYELYGRLLSITGAGESEGQPQLMSGKNVRVYYDAKHHPPTDYTPGTAPEFLENTIILAADAYALFMYALKMEHQAVTDLASARTAVGSANTAQAAVGTALTSMKKYLDNNATVDAIGVLANINALHADLVTAVAAANTYLDDVATDLTNADTVRDSYINTTNYVAGGTEPDILAYLTSGDALLNTITKGGQDERTPEMYAAFASAVKNALVAAFETDRQMYLQDATARTNAALGYTQEAAQRATNMRVYIETAEGYTNVAALFAREAESRLLQINYYLQQAIQYISAASDDLNTADRFRTDGDIRRAEAWSVWLDRRQYIGDFATAAMRQIPMNRGDRS